ncbi:MAG: membrane dipeptidase [Spirochaetales bacterium]|jgi:membrane dipeptidase
MVPIFDLHADVFMDLVRRAEAHNASERAETLGDFIELEERHLERMKAGGIFGAILTDCRMAGETAEPVHLERFIATVRRELAAVGAGKAPAPDGGAGRGQRRPAAPEATPHVIHVHSAADIGRALSDGAFAAIIGYEGLSATKGDLGWIRRLYEEAGLRVAVLTHNDDNVFGGGALGARGGLPMEEALGLTEKGREAVALMNEFGILIDMSHAGKATRRDILRASTRPVMLSHTSAKAVYDNGRNLCDEEMRAIADKGGLVGCMTSPAALAPMSDHGHHNLERYIEHLKRMIAAAGIDHVGLGLHFCEYLYTPEEYPPVAGLEDASKAQAIPEALLAAGFSEDEVEKIAWKNFARTFAQAVG